MYEQLKIGGERLSKYIGDIIAWGRLYGVDETPKAAETVFCLMVSVKQRDNDEGICLSQQRQLISFVSTMSPVYSTCLVLTPPRRDRE